MTASTFWAQPLRPRPPSTIFGSRFRPAIPTDTVGQHRLPADRDLELRRHRRDHSVLRPITGDCDHRRAAGLGLVRRLRHLYRHRRRAPRLCASATAARARRPTSSSPAQQLRRIAGVLSADNARSIRRHAGDNLVHLITRSTLTDSSTLAPNLQMPTASYSPGRPVGAEAAQDNLGMLLVPPRESAIELLRCA